MIYLPKSMDPANELPLAHDVYVTHGGHECPPYRASYCQGMFILCQPIGDDWYTVAHWSAALIKPGPLAIDLGQAWIATITPVLVFKLKEVINGS